MGPIPPVTVSQFPSFLVAIVQAIGVLRRNAPGGATCRNDIWRAGELASRAPRALDILGDRRPLPRYCVLGVVPRFRAEASPHQFRPSYEIRLFLTPPDLAPQTRGAELPLLETGDMYTSLAPICSKWATRGRRISSIAAESPASSPALFTLPISPYFLPQTRTLRRPTCVVDPIPTFVVRISCKGKQIIAQVSLGPLFAIWSEQGQLLLPSIL